MNTHWISLVALFVPLSLGQAQEKQAPEKTGSSEVTSTEAFQALMVELQGMRPKTAEEWNEKFPAFIAKVKERLKEFVTKYAGTDESFEARFQLAEIAVEVDKDRKGGIEMLQAILKELGKEESKKELRARGLFTLASVQKDGDDFTEAKKSLQRILEEFKGSPYEISAQDAIKELDTLAKLAIGNAPIPFEVTDLDGKKVSPASFQGKVLLIDFWATWCAPCRAELPNVTETYDTYKDQGFAILGVSLDKEGDRDKLVKFIQEKKMGWPQFYDGKYWDNEIAQLYSIRSIPATYLIDRAGKIRYRSLHGDELKKRVAELLAEKTPGK